MWGENANPNAYLVRKEKKKSLSYQKNAEKPVYEFGFVVSKDTPNTQSRQSVYSIASIDSKNIAEVIKL